MLNPKISFGPTGAPLPQPETSDIKEPINPQEPTQSVWNKILDSLKESEKPSIAFDPQGRALPLTEFEIKNSTPPLQDAINLGEVVLDVSKEGYENIKLRLLEFINSQNEQRKNAWEAVKKELQFMFRRDIPVTVPTSPIGENLNQDWWRPENPEKIDVQKLINDFLSLIKDTDFEELKKKLGKDYEKFIQALIMLGNKNIINIELPDNNLGKIIKELRDSISKLDPKIQSKILDQMSLAIAGYIKKKEQSLEAVASETIPDDWFEISPSERNRIINSFTINKQSTEDFLKSNRGYLEKLVGDIQEKIDRIGNDPKYQRDIKGLKNLISTILFILAASGLQTGAKPNQTTSDKATFIKSGYEEIYTPGFSTQKDEVFYQQSPDSNINDEKIEILKNISITSAEEARQEFGVKLGSVFGKRGLNVISIENKSGDQSVVQIMSEKNKQPLFVIIRHTKTPDGKLVIEPMNIESGYEIIEGVPTLNLNKLSEADRARLENGEEYHLVYGTYEKQNGAITKPFSQLGEISVSELIKELNKF